METIREIPGFRDVRLIGRGGSGVVYRAVHHGTDTAVAIKVLYPSVDKAVARRFRRERLIMRRLAGVKGVVGILDAGDLPDGSPYIVMQYCEGGSLVELLESRGPLDWRDAVALISDVAQTVAVAHDAGVCHRDLKPANILLTSWGATRVIDFGSSQIGDDEMVTVSSSKPMLTLAYSPPEVFADGEVDYTLVDVYSLAATLWALLVGCRPFKQPGGEDSPLALLGRIAKEPIGELPAEVPDALRVLVQDSMAKDPRDRPQSMSDFTSRLNDLRQLVPAAAGRRRSIGGFAVTSSQLSNAQRASEAASVGMETALDQLTGDPVGAVAQTTGPAGRYSGATSGRHRRKGGQLWYRTTALRSAVPAGLVALGLVLVGVVIGDGRSGDNELAADASLEPGAAVAGGADRSASIGDQSGVITPANTFGTSAAEQPGSTDDESGAGWRWAPNVPVSLPGANSPNSPDRGSTTPGSDGSPATLPSNTEPSASEGPTVAGPPADSSPQGSATTTVPATPVVNPAPNTTPAQASTTQPTVVSTTQPTVASTPPPTVASTTTTAQARFVFDDQKTIDGDDDGDEVKIKVLKNDDPGESSFNEATLRVVSAPSHAASHRVHKGRLHYRPASGFVGTDTIVYEVCTFDLRCGRATVTITVTSDD